MKNIKMLTCLSLVTLATGLNAVPASAMMAKQMAASDHNCYFEGAFVPCGSGGGSAVPKATTTVNPAQTPPKLPIGQAHH